MRSRVNSASSNLTVRRAGSAAVGKYSAFQAPAQTEAFLLRTARGSHGRAHVWMISFTRHHSRAGVIGAYGLTLPAVGLGLWAAVLLAGTDAQPLAATPLALAVALSAWYGGLGPGLFALAPGRSSASISSSSSPARCSTQPVPRRPSPSSHSSSDGSGSVSSPASSSGSASRIGERALDAESASTRAGRLAQLTSALAQARTARAAIEAIVQESLHALRADMGALLLDQPR